jgi:hypothetical protein
MKQTAVEFLESQYRFLELTKTDFEQAKEMEEKQDAKRLLFAYKVSLIIGLEKTGELLKEVDKEIKQEQ